MATKINAINLLILDPSSNDAEQTINILRNSGHAVRATQITNESDLAAALEKQTWDLFLLRDKLTDPSAEQCLKIVQHYGSDIPFILTTSEYSVDRTVEAMKLGMKDVVPEDNEDYFKLVVERELASIEDRRNRKMADLALKETDKRNELLLDSSRDAIAYITDGMHIYANNAYVELFGYKEPDDLECMPILDMIDSDQHDPFKKYIKSHSKGEVTEDFTFTGLNVDGTTFEALMSLKDSEYDGESCTQVYINTADGNDEELEQKLKELSAQDQLTGLYNRQYFLDSISSAVVKATSDNQLSAVLYLELDNFDKIQDQYGITLSDLFLKDVSQWLTDQLPAEVILARVGDDAFTILADIKNPNDAEAMATSLCEQYAKNMFEVSDQTVTDTLSIGICPVQETSPDANKILSNAHFASSRVQSKGGNGIRMHDNTLDSIDDRGEAQSLMEIQDAKDAGQLVLMYEPIVKLNGELEKMYHATLLIKTEQGDLKSITESFEIGQRSGVALKVDNWLMEGAFEEFGAYLPNNPDCKLKIQLCAASLLDDNLITKVTALLSQFKLPTDSVIFEFKEDDAVVF